jgi:hypothetical protein
MDDDGKSRKCGGEMKQASISRPFSPHTSVIGGPPDPPLFTFEYCATCRAMRVIHR